MVGFEPRAAHGDKTVGSRAVFLTVRQITGIVRGRGVLAINTFQSQGRAGCKNLIFRNVNEADAISAGILQNLPAAHGFAYGNALRESGQR